MPDSSFKMRGTEVPLDVRGADGHDHVLLFETRGGGVQMAQSCRNERRRRGAERHDHVSLFETRGGGVQMGAIMSRHSKQEEEGCRWHNHVERRGGERVI